MICKKCGKEIDDASKFCEYCGSKLKQKKKKGKIKKILLSVLIVIVVIVLAYVSRIWFVDIASNTLLKTGSNIDYNLYLYDDYIDVNITDIDLNSNILKFVDIDANLDICDENSSFEDPGNIHYSASQLLGIDESNIYFSENMNYVEKVSDAEISGSLVKINNIDFENGKKYKCYLTLSINPKCPKNQNLIKSTLKIDNALGVFGCFNYFESYFLYENGEFIKVN